MRVAMIRTFRCARATGFYLTCHLIHPKKGEGVFLAGGPSMSPR
jgi:hypothetical protein